MRASLQAAGRPDYRRCCPQDSLGMSATHAEVGPSQRGPLTQNLASPRGEARGKASASSAQDKTREHRCKRPGTRVPGVAVRRTASEWAPSMSEVGPSQRDPLTQSLAPPRSKAKGRASRSASSGAGQDAATSPQAAGHPDYRRCCPQDSLGMGATHVRGRPKPKRPLNAKPRIAAQQSQGESVEVRILRRRTDAGTSPQGGRTRRGTANENIAASDASPRPPAPNGNQQHPYVMSTKDTP